MTKVDLNVGVITALYENRIIKGIERALPVLLDELKRLTPEDTQEMLKSYKVLGVKKEGDTIVGTITNTAGYAIYVERGVEGVSYNYHKPKGTTFYSGVGNRTFARAVDNKRNEIIQIIYNAIDKG